MKRESIISYGLWIIVGVLFTIVLFLIFGKFGLINSNSDITKDNILNLSTNIDSNLINTNIPKCSDIFGISEDDFCKDTALFFITDDISKAKSILKKYSIKSISINVDYFSEMNLLGMYAFNIVDLNDSKISNYYSVYIPCQRNQTSGLVTSNIVCSDSLFSESLFNKVPSTWQNKPNELMDNTPIYIYRGDKKYELYILNSASNNTILAKMWFGSSDVSGFVKLISDTGNIKKYEININELNN